MVPSNFRQITLTDIVSRVHYDGEALSIIRYFGVRSQKQVASDRFGFRRTPLNSLKLSVLIELQTYVNYDGEVVGRHRHNQILADLIKVDDLSVLIEVQT